MFTERASSFSMDLRYAPFDRGAATDDTLWIKFRVSGWLLISYSS